MDKVETALTNELIEKAKNLTRFDDSSLVRKKIRDAGSTDWNNRAEQRYDLYTLPSWIVAEYLDGYDRAKNL